MLKCLSSSLPVPYRLRHTGRYYQRSGSPWIGTPCYPPTHVIGARHGKSSPARSPPSQLDEPDIAHCGFFDTDSIMVAFSTLESRGGTGASSLASSRRAPVEHAEMQSPHPMQRLASMTAISSCIDRASMGHLSMQSPQPMHSPSSMAAMKLEVAAKLGEAAFFSPCTMPQ